MNIGILLLYIWWCVCALRSVHALNSIGTYIHNIRIKMFLCSDCWLQTADVDNEFFWRKKAAKPDRIMNTEKYEFIVWSEAKSEKRLFFTIYILFLFVFVFFFSFSRFISWAMKIILFSFNYYLENGQTTDSNLIISFRIAFYHWSLYIANNHNKKKLSIRMQLN